MRRPAPAPIIVAASAALALRSRAAARRASTTAATKAAAKMRQAQRDADEAVVLKFIRERRQKLYTLAECRRTSYLTTHCPLLSSGHALTGALARRMLRAEELLPPARKRK